MGLGFYGRRESRGMIETRLSRLFQRGDIDDPLLRFSIQCESGQMDSLTETVSLVSLFSLHEPCPMLLAPSPAATPLPCRSDRFGNASRLEATAPRPGHADGNSATPIEPGRRSPSRPR